MKFEDQITTLCAQALAAHEEKEVRQILAELRHVVHQRIEHLRSYLQASYRAAARVQTLPAPRRTWQNVVHEITHEPDPKRVLQLTRELNTLLQSANDVPGCREKSA
jgi:uncharacterized membrane protein YccC